MKKIIYTISKLSNYGGMERILTEKANYLSDYFDITIITINHGGVFAYFLDKRIKHFDLEIKYQERWNITNISHIANYLKLRVLHKNKLQDLVNKILPDFIVTLGSGDASLIPKIKTNAKIFWECHFGRHYFISDAFNANQKFTTKIFRYIINYFRDNLAKKYDKLIVLTEEDSKQWKTENLITIPNFITGNVNKQSLLTDKIAVTIGRLEKEKGYDILLDIWKVIYDKYPNWILNIYGEGSQRTLLEKKIYDLNLKNTVFLKGITNNVEEVYVNASMFLSTSLFEGFPLVVIEAISSGLPVISFDTCGSKEILKNNSGIIINSYDKEAFSKAIIYLIENENARKQIGKNSKIESGKFEKDIIMKKWIELFNE